MQLDWIPRDVFTEAESEVEEKTAEAEPGVEEKTAEAEPEVEEKTAEPEAEDDVLPEVWDRFPGELCCLICEFLGTDNQRILRREIRRTLTCAPVHLDTLPDEAPVRCLITDYNPPDTQDEPNIDIDVLLDRREILTSGDFRRITGFRLWARREPSVVTKIEKHNMSLGDYVEYTANIFEATFYIPDLDDHQMDPMAVTIDEMLTTLFDLRFSPEVGDIQLPEESEEAQAIREFMPFVETARRIERRRQLGQDEEKGDPYEWPFTEMEINTQLHTRL